MTFTPADHVTEQEPGRWEDCTFAAMLETMRLSLPNGDQIPATIEEVNRFRANAGYPDDHGGVTIEDTIPAAKRRYGLTDDQYALTRDFDTLAVALADPRAVCVVTGIVPAAERVTPFAGPHAVAKHGVRVRCDPLGPKDGKYQGNTWSIATWRQFTSSLPGWQAFIMEARGDDGMIAAGGIALTSNKTIKATVATPALDAPGGASVLTMTVGMKVPYMGNASGHRVGLFNTGRPYPDKVARPTYLYVAVAAVVVENVPPVPTVDVKHEVETRVDGVTRWKETI